MRYAYAYAHAAYNCITLATHSGHNVNTVNALALAARRYSRPATGYSAFTVDVRSRPVTGGRATDPNILDPDPPAASS